MMDWETAKITVKEYLADEKKRAYIIVGVTFALGILFLAFVIIPRFGSLSRVSRVVRDLNENITRAENRIKRIEEFKKNLYELRAEQEGYARRIPAQKDIPRLLEGLASVAKSANVKILSINPYGIATDKKKKKAVSYYSRFPIRITAKSGYHQLGHFISALEEGDRFITIKDVEIKSDSKFPRKHSVQMVLETYVLGADGKK